MTDEKDSDVDASPKKTRPRGPRAPVGAAPTHRAKAVQVGAGEPVSARKRQEQQRAIDTRQTILAAALSEFAEMGFDAASIRNIGARTGLQHPLITYHYRTKEILWRAVAENAFAEIRRLWDEDVPDDARMPPIERLRAEYSAFLRFTIAYPDFHHFMLRESRPGNPRLPWLVETILKPTMQRLLPQIRSAQADGDLPQSDPSLIHYMMIGMMSVLSSLKDEIQQSTGLRADDPAVVDAYLAMIDRLVFRPGVAAWTAPARSER
jgi:AcrR family transcriptional regulator